MERRADGPKFHMHFATFLMFIKKKAVRQRMLNNVNVWQCMCLCRFFTCVVIMVMIIIPMVIVRLWGDGDSHGITNMYSWCSLSSPI